MSRTCLTTIVLLAVGCSAPSEEGAALETQDAPVVSTATVQGPSGEMQVQWVDVDGWAMAEGDIILGHSKELRSRASAHKDLGARWERAVIPYVIDDYMYKPSRITDAMAHIMENTSVTFVPATDQTDYVYFIQEDGCASYVGRQGGVQEAIVGTACSIGNVIHELGHVAGLWHEHTRADRDEHVQILAECIEPGYEHNFQVVDQMAFVHGDYDTHSIMHYGSTAFATGDAGCDNTMLSNDGSIMTPTEVLSPGDVAALNAVYQAQSPYLQLDIPAHEFVRGDTGTVTVAGVAPGKRAFLVGSVTGIGGAVCPPQLGGECLMLAGTPTLLGSANANEAGVATVLVNVAPGISGNLAIQAVTMNGGDASLSPAIEVPVRNTASTCAAGEIPDCSGACYPDFWVGDLYCDDGGPYSWGSPDFYCSLYSFDAGDCE